MPQGGGARSLNSMAAGTLPALATQGLMLALGPRDMQAILLDRGVDVLLFSSGAGDMGHACE